MSDWSAFEKRLAKALRAVTDRVYLIVRSAADETHYVQFAAQGDRLDAQAAGVRLVPEVDEGALLTAGWQAAADGVSNWESPLRLPALTEEYEDLAERCVVALRDAYGIASPDELVYTAWRDPEVLPDGAELSEARLAALDRGDLDLQIPVLELQRVAPPQPGRRIPATLEEAASKLVASPVGLVPFQIRGQSLALRGAESDLEAAAPVTADYFLGAALELPGEDVPVTAATLASWRVELSAVIAAAISAHADDIEEVTPAGAATVIRGRAFAAAVLHDARALAPHVADGGTPVIIVPDVGTVVLGRAGDEASLSALATAAEQVLAESARAVSATPLVATADGWALFTWPDGIAEDVRRLQRRWDSIQYRAARPVLQETYRRAGKDVFVPECVLATDPSGRIVTYAALLDGRTVTPRADLLVLNDGSGGIRPVPFDEIAALDGVLVPAPGAVPEHFLVTRFPAELL